ncbi:hypothetical protein FA13DRAFT_1800680 [Coprinellus micaceus]|uniref:F-box domain-containing protein n=1 Tax=Coprinellus micaceus TaxID=71717 RepID=A0A4Y7SGG7_COPMI|nr:hypothetical protein FA13DRAFT_1800680 [Coprinellus micaceus]
MRPSSLTLLGLIQSKLHRMQDSERQAGHREGHLASAASDYGASNSSSLPSASEEDGETNGTPISPSSTTQQPASQLVLPTELWQVIFLYAVTRPKNLWNRKKQVRHKHEQESIFFGVDQLFVIRMVCQLWNALALATPELWSAILDPHMGKSVFSLCVERSGEGRGLRICTDRSSHSSLFLPPSRWDAIRGRMDRTVELCLALNNQSYRYSYLESLTRVLEEAAPELERLALCCTADIRSTLFDNSAFNLRELTLINCMIPPQSCYVNLAALHIEFKDPLSFGTALKLAHVAEWLSLCVTLPALGGLRLIGVQWENARLPENPSLPPSLGDFAFSGDLASCQWMSGFSLPMSCNIDLGVDMRGTSWDAEIILRDVVRWTGASLDPNATLTSIDIAVKHSFPRQSCVVRRASKVQRIVVSVMSTSGRHQTSLKSVFSGLSRVIVPGSPLPCSSSTLVGPETWLQFDIESVRPEYGVGPYNEVLGRFLGSLDGLENVHIRNFSKRFAEHRDEFVPTGEFNPYEALGLFYQEKGNYLLFPRLRRVRFSGFHESQDNRLLEIAQFLCRRETRPVKPGRRHVVEVLELILREECKKRGGTARSVVLERGVDFDGYVRNVRRSQEEEELMFRKKVKGQLANAYALSRSFV